MTKPTTRKANRNAQHPPSEDDLDQTEPSVYVEDEHKPNVTHTPLERQLPMTSTPLPLNPGVTPLPIAPSATPFGAHMIPPLPNWNRVHANEWVKQARSWVTLVALHYNKPADLLTDIFVHYFLLSSNGDDLFVSVIESCVAEKAKTGDILARLKAMFGSLSVNEGQAAHDAVLAFRILPSENLKTAWTRYNTLVQRASKADNCPPDATLSHTFLKALHTSKYADLARQLRFQYRNHLKISWALLHNEMSALTITWIEPDNIRVPQISHPPRPPVPRPSQLTTAHSTRMVTPRPISRGKCANCGRTEHSHPSRCPAKEAICKSCNKTGHFARYCPTPTHPKSEVRRTFQPDLRYVIDGGCTRTLFHNSLLPFCDDPHPNARPFRTSSGNTIWATHDGTLRFLVRSSTGEDVTIKLEGSFAPVDSYECLIAPTVALCSRDPAVPSYFEEHGVRIPVQYVGGSFLANLTPCAPLSMEDSDLELEEVARRTDDKIPLLDYYDKPDEQTMLFDLHRRLGHPGATRLHATARALGLDVTLKSVQEAANACEICPRVKATIPVPLPVPSANVANDGMAMIDIKGPLPVESKHGHLFFSVIVKYATRSISLMPLKTRDQSVSHVARFLQVNPDVKCLRSDNAAEFLGEEMRSVLLRHGVAHLTGAPHSPQSQGLVERAIQTITRILFCFLKDMNLPDELWDWALDAAEECYNRTVHTATGKSPWEAEGIKPLLPLLPGDMVAILPAKRLKRQGLLPSRTGYYFATKHAGCVTVLEPLPDRWDYHPLHPNRLSLLPLKTDNRDGSRVDPNVSRRTVGKPAMKKLVKNAEQEAPLRDVQSGLFHEADLKELLQIQKFQVLEPINELPEGSIVIRTRIRRIWKKTLDGPVAKSRLIVQAYNDDRPVDPATRLLGGPERRLVLAFGISKGYRGATADVRTAFLQVPYKEEVYVRLPKDVPIESGLVPNSIYRLRRSLYGMKESPKLFNDYLESILLSQGWSRLSPGLFYSQEAILASYVDDILVMAKDPLPLLQQLNDQLELDAPTLLDEGDTKYVGSLLSCRSTSTLVSCHHYVAEIPVFPEVTSLPRRDDFKMLEPKSEPISECVDQARSLVGKLGWLANCHHGYAFRFSFLSQLSHKCDETILKLIKKTCNEIVSNPLPPLSFVPVTRPEIRLFVDASFGSFVSRIGWILFLSDVDFPINSTHNPILWKSSKDARRHKSTASAELSAIVDCIHGSYGVVRLIQKLFPKTVLKVFTDSHTAYLQVTNVNHRKDPLCEAACEFAEQLLKDLSGSLCWVESKNQIADHLTKWKPLGQLPSLESPGREA